jgi:hypothetical protein
VISSGNESNSLPSTLLPHQIAFIETVLDPQSKKIVLLRADVGLEKLSTFITLVRQLLRERPNARVLFIVDRTVLRLDTEYRLSQANIRTMFFDVYHFREMIDSTTGKPTWPTGIAVVTNCFRLTLRPDIWVSLAETHWDLVIADEVYLDSARAKAIGEIVGSVDRVVLAPRIATELPQEFSKEDITLVEWRRNQIVDCDGIQLKAVPPVLHEIPYTLSEGELSLREAISNLSNMLFYGSYRDYVNDRLESSPAALETILDFTVNRPAERLKADLTDDLEDMEEDGNAFEHAESESEPEAAFDVTSIQFAAALAVDALEDSSDSKLGAFDKLLDRLSGSQMHQKRICVCAEYSDTLYYLSAEIEGRGISSLVIDINTGAADRHNFLKMFFEGQKILFSDKCAIEGLNLQKVTDLILYDVPVRTGQIELHRLLSEFDRFDKRNQLHIYVFAPSNISNNLIAEPIALLRGLISDQYEQQSE